MSVMVMPAFDILEQYQQILPMPPDECNCDGDANDGYSYSYISPQQDYVTKVLSYHPRYLRTFLAMRQSLLEGDGPLPYDQRYFIAIMAAARHRCTYLIHEAAVGFLRCGGDKTWLRGLKWAPPRMRHLAELNKLMAHRPWLIRKSHFEKLLGGAHSWSLSELVHAIVLMGHFHALSSFVHGCAVAPETSRIISGDLLLSCDAFLSDTTIQRNTNKDEEQSEGAIDVLLERMRRLEGEADQLCLTEDELRRNFHTVESQSAELPAGTVNPSSAGDFACFVEDAEFTYQDFFKRGTPSVTFRAEDYSWDDQGYSLISKLYQNMGCLLDDKFKIAYNLTYRTLGNKVNVDTRAFRRAVWYYIQTLFGICHDDYDYSVVNQLLERNLKAYMKIVTCYPERITRQDYDNCMHEFQHSEKVHVNIMLMEARLQSEMLYTLRELAKYMT